ncbi:MAG TPA: prepilin-type N-terminal cleavage/methylation domain-containing protein [Pyrinomonadaceae bacterium]|nr:prepilin-type N-terminal cleavage/methylation domain-containing protein [Pyrinomonadaceae bacterium]
MTRTEARLRARATPGASVTHRGRGFTLVELLIVVAVIAIVAALAIPSLIHARRAAHSASAVSSLRLIHSSQYSYHSSTGNYGDLSAIGPIIGDPLLRAGQKSYYVFTVTPDAARPTDDYAARATPAEPTTVTIWRHFYVDASGVLRWQAGAPAGAASAPVDQQ